MSDSRGVTGYAPVRPDLTGMCVSSSSWAMSGVGGMSVSVGPHTLARVRGDRGALPATGALRVARRALPAADDDARACRRPGAETAPGTPEDRFSGPYRLPG